MTSTEKLARLIREIEAIADKVAREQVLAVLDSAQNNAAETYASEVRADRGGELHVLTWADAPIVDGLTIEGMTAAADCHNCNRELGAKAIRFLRTRGYY